MSKKTTVLTFNAKELGRSLQEVAVDVIKSENQDIESRWFHSKKDVDLFYWRDPLKNIIKQQLTYYGQLVEWNVIEGVRTGLLIEDETSQQIKSSPLIQYDSEPQLHAIKQSIELIENVDGLAEDDRRQIIYNYSMSPKFGDHSPEEILKKYTKNKSSEKTDAPNLRVGAFRSTIQNLKNLLLRFIKR